MRGPSQPPPPHHHPMQEPPPALPGMDNGQMDSAWGPPMGGEYPPYSSNQQPQQQQPQQQPQSNKNWLHYGPQGERARDPSAGPSAGKFFKGGQPTPGDDWLNGQVKPTHGRNSAPPGYGAGQPGNGR
jgi:hypothetical protein